MDQPQEPIVSSQNQNFTPVVNSVPAFAKAPAGEPASSHTPVPHPVQKKKISSQTLILAFVTLAVGVAIPATVLIVNQGSDVRSRASEQRTLPTAFPLVSPTPVISGCNQSCTSHADCITGFFCTNQGICKNALCPTQTDCICTQLLK